MIKTRTCVAALLLGALSGGQSGTPSSRIVVANVQFDQRLWGTGSLPSVTFTVSTGRGSLEKFLGFLYVSDVPGAVASSPYPPQFVGEFLHPASVTVVLDRSPERGPITPYSHEKFIQGALFDLMGNLVVVTNEDYLDIVYDAEPVTYALDFETEDDFTTPIVNGQDLSTPPEFGRLLSLSSLQPASGPPHFGPAAFDSSPLGPNSLAEDQDLLVDSGNLLILQEDGTQNRMPGIFDKPDDSANGGTLVFDFTGFAFTEKVEPLSIDLVDIDGGLPGGVQVVLTDVLGRIRTYTVPSGWTEDISREGPPGFRTLDLTTLDPQPGFRVTATATESTNYIPGEVVRIEVEIIGSGAIDNLVFSREADPGAPAARGAGGPGTGGAPKMK